MGLAERILTGLGALWAHKLRTGLSVLGVVIGVAALVAIVSMIQGATAEISGQIVGLGARTITVNLYPTRVLQAGQAAGFLAEQISGELRAAAAVAEAVPISNTSGEAQVGFNQTSPLRVIGTTTDYARLFEFWPAQGRFLHPLDEGKSVMVLGARLATELLGPGEHVGRDLVVNLHNETLVFHIIGVMNPRGSVGNYDVDGQAYVPISLLQELSGNRYFSTYILQATHEGQVDEAVAQIEAILDQKFVDLTTTTATVAGRGAQQLIGAIRATTQIAPYTVQAQRELILAFEESTRTMMLILGGIAAISLLVGGIGIMNIMLVAVVERTREVGIRMATGARPGDILGQFLFEAVLVCIVGGMLGLLLGWLAGAIGARVGDWPFVLSPLPPAIAIAFSLLIGVAFGIYPAFRASRLDPVDALRHE